MMLIMKYDANLPVPATNDFNLVLMTCSVIVCLSKALADFELVIFLFVFVCLFILRQFLYVALAVLEQVL